MSKSSTVGFRDYIRYYISKTEKLGVHDFGHCKNPFCCHWESEKCHGLRLIYMMERCKPAFINIFAMSDGLFFVIAAIYMARYKQKNKRALTRSEGIYMVMTILMVTHKFHSDVDQMHNVDVCDAFGLKLDKLNAMELEFLRVIEWNVHVSEKDIIEFVNG